VSVPSLKSVGPSTPTPPGQGSAEPGRRADVAKLGGILVLVTMVLLATLIVGIVIGNAARKRFDKWARGY
jgi:hypothetical protein